jgi:hypothetical protein
LYERQAMGHRNRAIISYFSDVFEKLEKYQEEIFKPRAKRCYNGKPTKKVAKYLKIRQRVENINPEIFLK